MGCYTVIGLVAVFTLPKVYDTYKVCLSLIYSKFFVILQIFVYLELQVVIFCEQTSTSRLNQAMHYFFGCCRSTLSMFLVSYRRRLLPGSLCVLCVFMIPLSPVLGLAIRSYLLNHNDLEHRIGHRRVKGRYRYIPLHYLQFNCLYIRCLKVIEFWFPYLYIFSLGAD